MDVLSFQASLADEAPPAGVALPLQALWWDAKGDWDRAHQCAQADNGADGAAVHAYLHRKEPDPANARYWYNRSGRTPAGGSLEQEWWDLATEMLQGQPD
jgi:hypothetical protein